MIDVAIMNERKLAEEDRKNKSSYSTPILKQECELQAQKHEQLAEWLEELKKLREENSELHNELQAVEATLPDMEKSIREQAIDDFVEVLHSKIHSELLDCADELAWVDRIAERLKGGNNDGE